MGKPPRGPELFEVMAERRAKGVGRQTPLGEAPAEGPPPPVRPVGPPPTGREIVFGMDTAFVLFVAALLFIACAYVVGYQNGKREAQGRTLRDKGAPLEVRSDVTAIEGIEGRPIQPTVAVGGNEFTLRLAATQKKTEADLGKLRAEQRYVEEQPIVREEGLQALVFDSGGVYTMGVGLFEKRDDPRLVKLQKSFSANPGPAIAKRQLPYRDCSPAQTKDLGTLVP
jgi:hypothetical protein